MLVKEQEQALVVAFREAFRQKLRLVPYEAPVVEGKDEGGR